jgi:asparagine synthase (glutamine-hydrolysing)
MHSQAFVVKVSCIMCGIAGYYGMSEIPSWRIKHCLSLMRRRGPDARSVVNHFTQHGRTLHLLHSRLSIIDLHARSEQPFRDGDTILSFNGEVYNYKEVRQKLIKDGFYFKTDSDTEVLFKILTHKGIEGVSDCEGMWGFAWYDSDQENLYLCRDRFGEKPLYYYELQGDIYFGSEPKFIFALLGSKLSVDYQHLTRYLVNGYKSLYKTDELFFQGLNEVKPSHYRCVSSSGSVHELSYWQPKFNTEDEDMSYEEAVSATRKALIRSVELRTRADVPVAYCLSGGVDSNALVSIATNVLGFDVHGFTIANTDQRYEERDIINAAVSDLSIEHTEVPLSTENFLPRLRELIYYHDAPVYTISSFAQWSLMQKVSQSGYRVTISGVGADELFSGYYDHHNAYLAVMYQEDKLRYREALSEWLQTIEPIVRNPFLKDPDYFRKNSSARDHIFLDSQEFAKMMKVDFNEPFTESEYSNKLLRNRMANELFHEAVPILLHESDLNSMYYSIEDRSPFLDSSLFDLTQQIPTKYLVRKGLAKSILRESIRGIAPDIVIDNKRKVGFNAPLFDFLDLSDSKTYSSLISDSPIFDIVRQDQIEKILHQKSLPNSKSKFLFNFICARIFLEEFS